MWKSGVVIIYTSFFFFKQKTAYEMRISDWSSDVCSSDLSPRHQHRRADGAGGAGCLVWQQLAHHRQQRVWRDAGADVHGLHALPQHSERSAARQKGPARDRSFDDLFPDRGYLHSIHAGDAARRLGLEFVRVDLGRSEEHTSELQSLMRISYAVFCLKKKKVHITRT